MTQLCALAAAREALLLLLLCLANPSTVAGLFGMSGSTILSLVFAIEQSIIIIGVARITVCLSTKYEVSSITVICQDIIVSWFRII
jgi:hypothetical protein